MHRMNGPRVHLTGPLGPAVGDAKLALVHGQAQAPYSSAPLQTYQPADAFEGRTTCPGIRCPLAEKASALVPRLIMVTLIVRPTLAGARIASECESVG